MNEYKYSKMRIDNKKVNEKERPTDLTYERYIKLIQFVCTICNLINYHNNFLLNDLMD